jgi:hypothetical protein
MLKEDGLVDIALGIGLQSAALFQGPDSQRLCHC